MAYPFNPKYPVKVLLEGFGVHAGLAGMPIARFARSRPQAVGCRLWPEWKEAIGLSDPKLVGSWPAGGAFRFALFIVDSF